MTAKAASGRATANLLVSKTAEAKHVGISDLLAGGILTPEKSSKKEINGGTGKTRYGFRLSAHLGARHMDMVTIEEKQPSNSRQLTLRMSHGANNSNHENF